MKRFLILTLLLLGPALALAQSPVKTPVKKVSAPPAPAVAPAPPGVPAEAPIPFAPLGPPPFGDAPVAEPQAAVGNGDAVTVYFEEGTSRFLAFDERGWLPDVKQLQLSVSAVGVGSRSLELVSYPGPYAPSAPDVRKYDLAKIATLTAAEFQTKLDEASRGVAQLNGVAAR